MHSHACEDRPLQSAKSRFFWFAPQERERKAGGHPKPEGWVGWAGGAAVRQPVEARGGMAWIQSPARSEKLTLGVAPAPEMTTNCPFGRGRSGLFSPA